jgi:hypothetical protein
MLPEALPEVEPEALPDILPDPESTVPVDAPPRGPFSFTCALQPANAKAPMSSGTASIVVFMVFTPFLVLSNSVDTVQWRDSPGEDHRLNPAFVSKGAFGS